MIIPFPSTNPSSNPSSNPSIPVKRTSKDFGFSPKSWLSSLQSPRQAAERVRSPETRQAQRGVGQMNPTCFMDFLWGKLWNYLETICPANHVENYRRVPPNGSFRWKMTTNRCIFAVPKHEVTQIFLSFCSELLCHWSRPCRGINSRSIFLHRSAQ